MMSLRRSRLLRLRASNDTIPPILDWLSEKNGAGNCVLANGNTLGCCALHVLPCDTSNLCEQRPVGSRLAEGLGRYCLSLLWMSEPAGRGDALVSLALGFAARPLRHKAHTRWANVGFDGVRADETGIQSAKRKCRITWDRQGRPGEVYPQTEQALVLFVSWWCSPGLSSDGLSFHMGLVRHRRFALGRLIPDAPVNIALCLILRRKLKWVYATVHRRVAMRTPE